MKNNSSSNEFYKPQECPYLEEAAWRDEFLLTEGTLPSGCYNQHQFHLSFTNCAVECSGDICCRNKETFAK